MKNYVAYYRVSTQMQGIEGLGIQSQINAVTNYVNGNGNIIATYSEVETSKKKRNVSKYIKQLNMLKLIMLYWLLQNWIDLHVMYHLQVLYIMVILILCCDNHLLIN
jgi:hypothetical protein